MRPPPGLETMLEERAASAEAFLPTSTGSVSSIHSKDDPLGGAPAPSATAGAGPQQLGPATVPCAPIPLAGDGEGEVVKRNKHTVRRRAMRLWRQQLLQEQQQQQQQQPQQPQPQSLQPGLPKQRQPQGGRPGLARNGKAASKIQVSDLRAQLRKQGETVLKQMSTTAPMTTSPLPQRVQLSSLSSWNGATVPPPPKKETDDDRLDEVSMMVLQILAACMK